MNGVTTHRMTGSLAISVLAGLSLAQPMAASGTDGIDWRAAVNVRNANGAGLQDADFLDRNVAVAWEETGSGPTSVGIRTSVTSGNSFGPISTIPRARQPAVDLCGGAELHAVYSKKLAAHDWAIEHAVGSTDGDGFTVTTVTPDPGVVGLPDVACAGARVFVTWYSARATKIASRWRMPFQREISAPRSTSASTMTSSEAWPWRA